MRTRSQCRKPAALHAAVVPALLLAIAGCQSAPPAGENTAPAGNAAAGNAAAPMTSTRPSEPAAGFVRGLHAVTGAGPISLTANNAPLVENVAYSEASGFVGVKDGKIKVYAAGADGKNIAGPMPLTLDGGDDVTVVVTGVPGDVEMLPFNHKSHGVAEGKAKVTFMHAAKSLPGVDLSVDGASYRKGVKYGIATDYKELPPGRHSMVVQYQQPIPAPTVPGAAGRPATATQSVSLTQDLDLAANKVYSVFVYQDEQKLPKLKMIEDKFVPVLKDAPQSAASSQPKK
jgi:hypothetical protein